VFNVSEPNEAWLQLDTIGNAHNTPTIGGISNTVLHFMADLADEHNFKYAIIVYSDMKSFPSSMRLRGINKAK
jgi:hypothetical protein